MCVYGRAVLALLTLASLTSGQGTDRIQDPETSGCTIVELVLERIETQVLNELYSDPATDMRTIGSTKAFLMRIAAVESDYGRAGHTYRDNYHGGIWQVDEDDFVATRTNEDGTLEAPLSFISLRLGIDWLNTGLTWEDLRRPLYSGLAAMLKIFLVDEPIPNNVPDQAIFWINYYHSNTLMTNDFIALADSRCSIQCQSYPDIVFVVDSSGSIGSTQFQVALNFIANLVPHFQVGEDFTHIGVITYNSLPTGQIALDRYFDASELSAAIRSITYTGGGTQTGRAIQYATDTSFSSSNGARDDGRSRVGIVMTDGQSGDSVVGPSNAARDAGINLIAIGIGSGIVEAELLQIAGSSGQVYLVETFTDLSSFSSAIETVSCLSAVALESGDTLLANLMDEEVRYLSLTVTPGEVITLHIMAMNGITVYGSLLTAMPGPDAYDFKLVINDGELVATDYLITIPDPSEGDGKRKRRQTEESTLVLAFVGMSDNASFELNVTEGDNRRYGDLAVSLNEEANPDGTVFYVCEANCTCEQAFINFTVSTAGVDLPVGSILDQISDRRVEVTLPSSYLGLLHCVIATAGVSGSEVFSTINITDVNECRRPDTHNCSAESSTCKDIVGGFECVCKDGFIAEDVYTCTDINECNLGLHNCNPKTTVCMNTAGSYECPCKRGYRLEASSQRCTGPFLEDLTLISGQEHADVARDSLDNWINVWGSAGRELPDSPFNFLRLPVESVDAGYSYFVDSGRFAYKFDVSTGADASGMKLMVTKYSFE